MSIGTTGAIIGAGVLGAGASVAGGAIAASGAKDASAQAAAAQQQAIAAQQALAQQGLGILSQQNDAAQKMLQPFVESQKKALGGLEGFTDPNNPIYGQARDFATRQIQQQLAAQGLLRSRGQGDSLANLELGLNQQRLGVLGGLAGSGAGQTQAGIAQQYGLSAAGLLGGISPGIASSISGLGQAQAAGTLGAAQAVGQGVAGVGNAIQGSLGNVLSYNQYQSQLGLLQQLLGKGGTAPVGTGAFGGAQVGSSFGVGSQSL